jgi:hypothetical protein
MNRQKTIEPVEKLSGRELDAAVAERAMAHIAHADNGEGFCENCGEEMLEWKQMRYRQQGGIEPVEMRCVPEYSESIEAAMEVVEKMRRDHFRFACNDRCDPKSGEWWAEFATLEYERGGQASAGTLPEAVCRAALTAVESSGSD